MSKYELELSDLMDARYGAGNWTERTGIGIGTDIGPAIADGVALLRSTTSTGRGKIKIGSARWLMNTSPGDLSGINLEGVESMASVIVYNNAAGAALLWSGLGGYTGGGARGLGLMLESGLGNTGAYGIFLQGNATFQPDQTEWDEIYMSSIGATSFWYDGFHADGSARSSPQGIRIATMREVEIFNCRNVPLYLSNVVGWTLENVGVFTGVGPYGNDIFIVGGSTHVTGVGLNYGGSLHTSPSLDVLVNGQRLS